MKNKETVISEYVNVSYDGTKWQKLWGEIIGQTLFLYESKAKENLHPMHTIEIQDVNIVPAIKQTNRILAFIVEQHGTPKVLLEPLSVLDMGRWISSIFITIQGVSTVQTPDKSIMTSVTIAVNDDIDSLQNEIKQDSLQQSEENLVDVKKMTLMFEKMTDKQITTDSTYIKVNRSQSTPNLADDIKCSDIPENFKFLTQVSQESNQNTSKMEQNEIKPVVVSTIKKSNTETNIKCWNGPYKAQETEKQVLEQIANPFLVKRRLTKQEKQLYRLQQTVQETNENMDKLKQILNQRREAIIELQTDETANTEEIMKLENECTLLEEQIMESQQNVQKHKLQTHQIENEITNLSKTVEWDGDTKYDSKVDNLNLPTETESHLNKNHENDYQSISDTTGQNGYHPEQLSDDEENEELFKYNKNAPEWVKKAQDKSKKAYKILSKQGILN